MGGRMGGRMGRLERRAGWEGLNAQVGQCQPLLTSQTGRISHHTALVAPCPTRGRASPPHARQHKALPRVGHGATMQGDVIAL